MSLKSKITNNLINLPGWHTKRKIVVIESDDWGAVRMFSKESYRSLLSKGIRVDKDPYNKYDGLETKEDLYNLYEVLTTIKDKNGRHPVITANAVVANPDFTKIKEENFHKYHYELLTDTLGKSVRHSGAWEAWREGMKAGFLHPQFHGREHLNVKMWMRALQKGDKLVHEAFKHNIFGLTPAVDKRIEHSFMGAFDSYLKEDIDNYRIIIKEGLHLFENIFGFKSRSFIPTRYTWPMEIEKFAKDGGVQFLQGMISQSIPLDEWKIFKYKKNNFLGKRSPGGLIYLMRNAYFEPSQNKSFPWLDDALRRIKIAFTWNKPAIISIHRLNFIGSIDSYNTDFTLPLFKSLLNEIIIKWPSVEFMTSDELGNLIIKNK